MLMSGNFFWMNYHSKTYEVFKQTYPNRVHMNKAAYKNNITQSTYKCFCETLLSYSVAWPLIELFFYRNMLRIINLQSIMGLSGTGSVTEYIVHVYTWIKQFTHKQSNLQQSYNLWKPQGGHLLNVFVGALRMQTTIKEIMCQLIGSVPLTIFTHISIRN